VIVIDLAILCFGETIVITITEYWHPAFDPKPQVESALNAPATGTEAGELAGRNHAEVPLQRESKAFPSSSF
jgi:hypothetical protein